MLPDGVPPSRTILNAVVVAFELSLAAWLLSGTRRRLCRSVTAISFASFAAVSLRKALSGYQSCGCFGARTLSPWLSLLVDLASLSVLLRCLPPVERFTSSRLRFLFMLTSACAIYSLTVVADRIARDQRVDEPGFLEPQDWVGRRFPLLQHVDISDRIQRGRWIIVLLQPGCPACESVLNWLAMPRWAAPDTYCSGVSNVHLAIVAVATLGGRERDDVQRAACQYGQLDDAYTWYGDFPITIDLLDGVVRSSASGASAAIRLLDDARPAH